MPSPQPNVGPGAWRPFSFRFWLALIVGSAASGVAAGLLMRLLQLVQRVAWNVGSGDFLDAIRRSDTRHRCAIVLGAGVIVVVSRWLLRLRGSGHGGELAAAIWFRAGHLPVLRTLLNAVTSIVIVGMGASLGREAAPKQTGALIAGLLARWSGLGQAERRLLVACGAGAGMGAVYNVPFGGALFALEVLLGVLSLSLVVPALAASLIATAAAWLLLPDRATYDLPVVPVTPELLAWAAIAGPLLGLAAVLYVRLICWADAQKPRGWALFVAPLAAFAALGAAAIRFPELLGNGKDVVQMALAGSVPLLLALALAGLKPLATAACLGSGAPGGLFTPTLALGALLGAAGGQGWALLLPGFQPAPGACALIAGGAMLAASTQGPVSAIVLMLELTRRADASMVPLMLAVAGAMLVSRRLESRSVYSGRIHAGRERAGDDTVSSAARAAELLPRLALAPGGKLAVRDEEGTRIGSLDLDRALIALHESGVPEIATARDFLLLPSPAISTSD